MLVIGKVGAENLLSADEQLKDKGFWEKLVLISFYIIYYIAIHMDSVMLYIITPYIVYHI